MDRVKSHRAFHIGKNKAWLSLARGFVAPILLALDLPLAGLEVV